MVLFLVPLRPVTVFFRVCYVPLPSVMVRYGIFQGPFWPVTVFSGPSPSVTVRYGVFQGPLRSVTAFFRVH